MCDRYGIGRSTALGALLLCACAGPDAASHTMGERGRVEFTYTRGCFFGCPLEQPLLEGARQTIGVSGQGDGAGVRAASSDDDVLELHLERRCFCEHRDGVGRRVEIAVDAGCDGDRRKRCDNDVLVRAAGSGDAFVELFDEDDSLIDRARVAVRRAERASFFGTAPDALGREEAEAFALGVGEALALEVELYDDRGRRLLAHEGVTWRCEAEEVAVLSAWLAGRGAELRTGDAVDVEGLAAGEASVEVEVPGLVAAVEVSVD